MRRRRSDLLLALLGLLAATPAMTQELVPSVRLRPDPAGLGELVQLKIEVQNAPTNSYFDASFRLENLRQVSGPLSGSSVQIMNGRASSSRTLTWRFQPTAVGTARIFGIQIQVGDRQLDGGEVSAQIQEEIPANRQRRGRGGGSLVDELFEDDPLDRFFRSRRPTPRTEPRIFLRAEATPARPWVGQQVLYTLYLYTQADVVSVNPDRFPDFKGFWVREIPEPDGQRAQVEMIEHEGERFGRVRLLRRALFPRRAGELKIEPTQIGLRARLPDEGPFGMLRAHSTDLERASNAVTIDVRPLPDAPSGFQGAVGSLQLEGELEPTELAVGDAATLTLTLEGTGNLQGIAEPALPEIEGLKVFPPQQEASERLRGTRVTGRRTWRYVLVPERPGRYELPAIQVPYFDPSRGRFDAALVDGLALEARGATALAQDDGATVRLHPIRTAALPAAEGGVRWGRLLGWAFAIPWLLAAVWTVRARRGGSGKASDRRVLAAALATAQREDDPRRTAAAIEDAWRAYLDTRFGIAPGMASTQWRRELTDRGVKANTAEDLVQLADDLHYLRYAPKLSSTDDLRRELVERSHKLMRSL